jgi:hypothetical protein
MTAHADDIDPAEAMLAELAGLDLTLARHVHACAMAHEDPAVVSDLARAYQRVARSVRMTLALHARLKRERLRGGPAHAEPAHAGPAHAEPPAASPTRPPADEARAAGCRRAVRTALRRIVWAERERDAEAESPEALLERVERRLAREDRDAAFHLVFRDGAWAELPLDEHVVRLCRTVGLPDEAADGWRDLPDPPAPGDGALRPPFADSA